MERTDIKKVSNALLSMQRHSWEQGVAMQAFLEMGQDDYVCAMAFEAVNRSLEDGRAAIIGVTDGVTDHCSVGEGLKKACQLTGNEFLCKGREELLKWALQRAPRNEEGIVYHLTRTREFWADSFYMLDQPGEPIIWQGKIVASCFDLVTDETKVNTQHEMPATMAELDLEK